MTSPGAEFQPWLAAELPKIDFASAEAVLRLAGEGATVPFIARYRKEQTRGLDEVAIQAVIDARDKWDALLKRQKRVAGEIEKQGKLTPELQAKIFATVQLETLEDLYLPYRQKRKTKAATAREAGLEPLADWIWNCGHGTDTPQPGQTLELWAYTFRNPEKGIEEAAAAINGAQDILIERLGEIAELRQRVREDVFKSGVLKSAKAPKAKPHSKYETYFNHQEKIQVLLRPENSHRYLAMRRGKSEDELTLAVTGDFEADHLREYAAVACTVPDSPGAAVLDQAGRLAYREHVRPSIETEANTALKEVADAVAIGVFAENVRKLLLAAPFGPKAVLGADPGVRTGCKLALVDGSGGYAKNAVLMLQTDAGKAKAKEALVEFLAGVDIRAVAVGNGTAGRETEIFLRQALREGGHPELPVVMVSESGASVYSASDIARQEFPDLDITVRGAISIARRLQDPLAELVKVDPKAIGVGQYQHDVSQHRLKRTLEQVVESCVNQVGANLNTASAHLLAHVSGIGPALARNLVEHRAAHGLFKSRQALLEVSGFSRKAFEQAAGFLRVPESENPLDNTGVHPERYELLEARATQLGKAVRDFLGAAGAALRAQIANDAELKTQAGEFTVTDILRELERPGRDPREAFVPFQYREDIHALKDVQPGMICPGIITNVTNFGAFVDIGVHQDGLVHLSQMATHFVKDPRAVVSAGDRVQVRVLEVNLEKSQIALSMRVQAEQRRPQKPDGKREARPPRPARPAGPVGRPPKDRGPRRPSRHEDGPRPKHTPQPPRPKQVFNNAFAGLAGLRDQLKARK